MFNSAAIMKLNERDFVRDFVFLGSFLLVFGPDCGMLDYLFLGGHFTHQTSRDDVIQPYHAQVHSHLDFPNFSLDSHSNEEQFRCIHTKLNTE